MLEKRRKKKKHIDGGDGGIHNFCLFSVFCVQFHISLHSAYVARITLQILWVTIIIKGSFSFCVVARQLALAVSAGQRSRETHLALH